MSEDSSEAKNVTHGPTLPSMSDDRQDRRGQTLASTRYRV